MGQRKRKKTQGTLPLLSPAELLLFSRTNTTHELRNVSHQGKLAVFEGSVCVLS